MCRNHVVVTVSGFTGPREQPHQALSVAVGVITPSGCLYFVGWYRSRFSLPDTSASSTTGEPPEKSNTTRPVDVGRKAESSAGRERREPGGQRRLVSGHSRSPRLSRGARQAIPGPNA